MTDTQDLWNQIKSSLIAKNRDNKPFQAWFEETDLLDIERRDDGISCFRLGVRSELHRQWISEFCFDRICSEISAIYKSPYEIEMVVTGSPNITPVAEPEPSQNENSSSSPGVNYQKQGGFGSQV